MILMWRRPPISRCGFSHFSHVKNLVTNLVAGSDLVVHLVAGASSQHLVVHLVVVDAVTLSKSTLRKPLNLRLFTLLLPAKVLLRLLHKIWCFFGLFYGKTYLRLLKVDRQCGDTLIMTRKRIVFITATYQIDYQVDEKFSRIWLT